MVAKVPKGNYVLIGGDAGQTGSTLMQEGYHAVLDPLVEKGDIKIVMDQFTPAWKTEPAQANAENALTANDNKVDAFLVSYDGMSLGRAAGDRGGRHRARQDPRHRPGHGAVRRAGDRRGPPVRQPLAGARRDGGGAAPRPPSPWRKCKDIGATTTADNGAGDIPWVKTPIYLITPGRDGRVRLHAPALAEHRRGLQERPRPEAGLLEPGMADGGAARRDGEAGRAADAGARRRGAVQELLRRARARRRRASRSRPARSWRCSARTAPASRR